jgi:DNA-directed RNA polymerase subunit RPC12/RpoP
VRADNGLKLPSPPINSDAKATGDEITYTETYQCGYLNRLQLAFAFLIVCGMRRIPTSTYESGLRPEVLLSLKDCRATYSQYLGRRKIVPGMGDELDELMMGVQSTLSEISRTLTFLKGTYLDSLDSFLRNTHMRINQLQATSEGHDADKPIDPCIHYLNCLRLIPLIAELKEYSRQGELYSAGALRLARIVQTMEDPKCIPSEGLFTIVVCPNDGVTKLRLPADSGRVIAKCPHCRYRFIAKTSPPVFSPPSIWKRLQEILNTSTRRVRG